MAESLAMTGIERFFRIFHHLWDAEFLAILVNHLRVTLSLDNHITGSMLLKSNTSDGIILVSM